MIQRFLSAVWVPVLLICASGVRPATAEVVRFEIDHRAPYADGRAFESVGPYERISGRVFFEIDPTAPANAEIRDLANAPRNERGRVAFSADLDLLAPQDLTRARGAALYDVNNRGNKVALRFFNDSRSDNEIADPGNGYLMRHGWIVVWSGWDGELLPGNGRLQLDAPVARPTTAPVTGPVRCEICVSGDEITRTNVNGNGHGTYPPTERGLQNASLTWRLRAEDSRVPIPREQFHLHVLEVEDSREGQLPQVDLELPAGFRKGCLYELIYEAQDPIVHGVSFASVRDLMSALRNGSGPGNPLLHNGQSVIRRVHGFGVSQSGRYLREFLHSGFNADESGRKVFDGLMPHVAGGGLGSFNHRFAQPTAYNSQHEAHDWPCDRFPFTYETQTDPATGKTDGILQKAVADDAVPLVLHTQSSAEYWTRAGSLAHTDPGGEHDAGIPESVRIYAFGGTQHGPAGWPPARQLGQLPQNPADYRPHLRALLLALDDWSDGGPPAPPSAYPTISSGTLVAWQQQSTGFPALPDVRYPTSIHQPLILDPGPRWPSQGIIDHQPPQRIGHRPVRVPACGKDGNELGCLLPPEVAVPVATFTGWNLRDASAGAEGELIKLAGSRDPFPLTRFEQNWSGDPRASVEERFTSLEAYVAELTRVCDELVAARYLLSEDVEHILATQESRVRQLFLQIERDAAVASEPKLLLESGAGEGPAWHRRYGLLFSGDGGINQLTAARSAEVWRADAGTNGLLFDRAGRLIACEPRLRRVTRTERDGTLTVLTEQYEGHPYNQPNDLAVDSQGRIYFSDPQYGARENMAMRDEASREIEGVYRIDRNGTVQRIITHEVDRPNGLLITPDDRYLYVADNNNNSAGGARILWRFQLREDGTITPNSRKDVFDWHTGRGPDGMAQDIHGRLYVAAGRTTATPWESAGRYEGGVYVFSPDNRLIDLIPIPRDEVTNCAFGDDDLQTLYITAGGSLWSVRTTAPGMGSGAVR